MTASATALPSTVARTSAAADAPIAAHTSPADRGTTTLADRVVEKIAGQAAAEVSTALGKSGGFLGIGAEHDASARPKVGVTITQNVVELELAVGVSYPGSLRSAAQQVRERVTQRVQELTGLAVHRVDVDIAFLDVSTPDSKAIIR